MDIVQVYKSSMLCRVARFFQQIKIGEKMNVEEYITLTFGNFQVVKGN